MADGHHPAFQLGRRLGGSHPCLLDGSPGHHRACVTGPPTWTFRASVVGRHRPYARCSPSRDPSWQLHRCRSWSTCDKPATQCRRLRRARRRGSRRPDPARGATRSHRPRLLARKQRGSQAVTPALEAGPEQGVRAITCSRPTASRSAPVPGALVRHGCPPPTLNRVPARRK